MKDRELSFLDVISIASFIVSLQNLDMNITQEDMAKTAERLDKILRLNVEDLHKHLKEQDEKLTKILNNIDNIINTIKEESNGDS